MPRILYCFSGHNIGVSWTTGFRRQFSSKIQVFAAMPKAETGSKNKGLVTSLRRRPPIKIQEGEESTK